MKLWPPGRTASFEAVRRTAAADATYNKIYTDWKEFRENSNRWFSAAELSFINFASAQES